MSIDLTGVGNAGIDWSGVLSAVNSKESTTKIEGVKVDAAKDGVGLTFSVSEDGAVRTVELSMPMLDSPSEIDEGLLAGFCEKLGGGSVLNLTDAQVKAFCEELTAQLKALGESLGANATSAAGDSKASQSVMFDIYTLMALLVECGQKMRDAARDVRQAENVQVQHSIQTQADMQRTAALTGLVCSVVVCAIQVGMQIGNMAYQGKGFSKQMDAHKMSGLENAKTELKMAEMQTKPQDAQVNFEKISQKTDPAVRTEVESTFNDSQSTKAAFDDAALQQRIDAKTADLNALRAPGSNGELKQLTPEQEQLAVRLEAEIAADNNLKGMSLADRKTLYRTQIKSELADIRNNPASTPEEIAYAEAYAAKEISLNSTPEQLAADLATAQSNYNQANMVMQHDVAYLKGMHMETRARMFGDMIAALGNVAQGCVSSISQMISAEATEVGAEQQKSQEMLDQAKDLFSQCQSLIDSVIQLMRAVLQAEVQSMRDAIQA